MFNRDTCHFELVDVVRQDTSGIEAVSSPIASLTRSSKAADRLVAFTSIRHKKASDGKPFPWQHLVAGAAAGAVSRSATAPLELLRLQAMTGGASVTVHSTGGTAVLKQRPSLLQALQAATGDRGWTGLWRGNGLNVLRAGPQKAIDFFTFELYKLGTGPAAVLSSAALAGATSTVILHPLEVVRSRVTCDRVGRYSQGITAAFGSIISKEGPLVLYTGLGSSLAAIMPEAAITYGLFDLLSKAYMRQTDREKPGVGFAVAAGVVSSCLGQTVSFPLETISRRLQVGMINGAQANLGSTVQSVLSEAGVLGFYKGFRIGAFRAVPMSALSFGTYELVRAWLAVQSGSISSSPYTQNDMQSLEAT